MARRRRTTSSRRSAATPTPVVAGPGERLWLLEVPWDQRAAASAAGARWDATRATWAYTGVALPDALAGWLPAEFSWAAWQDSTASGVWPDHPGDGTFTLRAHQVEAAAYIAAAHQLGRPQFVLADDLGLGKTLSAIAGVHALPDSVRDVLVACPVSVMPAWRDTLRRFGTGGRRWCIVSIDSLRQLLEVPASAAAAKKPSTRNRRIIDHGRPKVAFDVAIFDESHRRKNPAAQRSKAAAALARGTFEICLSGTLGSTPLEVSYLAPVLAHVTGDAVDNLAKFEPWARRHGFQIEEGDYGRWTWTVNDPDLQRLRRLLFDPPDNGKVPVGLRRRPTELAGWPDQDRPLRPIALTADQQRLYDAAWTEFRRELALARGGRDPSGGFAATLRFRQKASLLRADAVAQTAVDLMVDGYQPAVSVEFLETRDHIVDRLATARIDVATIDGSTPAAERETERRRFQSGAAPIIVHTLVEGVNLHATEQGANQAPRVTVVGDPRQSMLAARQIEGRTQRDGCRAPALYLYAPDTVEEQAVVRYVERLKQMATLQGDDGDHHALDELLANLAA